MAIHSNGPGEDIFSYCSKYLINIEDTELWDDATKSIIQTHPHSNIAQDYVGTFTRLRIPNFQRGIEWDFQMLMECIESRSKSLGIVVMGRTVTVPNVDFILDGLQRFSAFTFLIQKLQVLFFTTPSAANPNPAGLAAAVVNRPSVQAIRNVAAPSIGRLPRIRYNHQALQLVRRKAVAQSYALWCQKAGERIDQLLVPTNPRFQLPKCEGFLDALAEFVQKPLFIQELSNFANVAELLATFQGLNTIRVELTPADVCRCIVIDGMISANASAQDVLEVDNDFNDTFLTPTGRIKRGLDPLIKVLESEWTGQQQHSLLPALFTMPPVAAAIHAEFNEFIAWISFIEGCRNTSPYLDFIGDVGENPYVATLLFYFHKHKAAGTLTTAPPEAELHQIAIAYFRQLLDGGVGDTLPITKRAGQNAFANVQLFIQAVNPLRAGPINAAVRPAWLQTALSEVRGPATARVVFNACLLPIIRGNAPQPYGTAFTPVAFTSGQNNWQIDHLIPTNTFLQQQNPSPGDPYKDSMRNFCPVIGTDNGTFKATDCAHKLDLASAHYTTYRTNPVRRPGGSTHPFIDSILTVQGVNGGNPELDNRDWLINPSPATTRCYGQERLDALQTILKDRI